MDQICAQFGITRQAHYQMVKREAHRQIEEEIIVEMVRQFRRKHPRLGTRKLLYKIQPMMVIEGLQIGRDRLFSLLRERDMLVPRKKGYRRTTSPGHWRTPNLLPGLTISQPNQVWVCDITYLEVELGRFAYLFLLMDLFSRFIVGWHVATSLAADGAVESLQMALKKLPEMKTNELNIQIAEAKEKVKLLYDRWEKLEEIKNKAEKTKRVVSVCGKDFDDNTISESTYIGTSLSPS